MATVIPTPNPQPNPYEKKKKKKKKVGHFNTSVIRVLSLPFGALRWWSRDSTVETTFPVPNICMHKRKKKKQNKTNLKCCTVSKWQENNRFLFRIILILAKIWKNTLPKKFFNKFWLIVRQHEYIKHCWNKNWKFLFPDDFSGKQFFHTAKNAN